MKQMLVAIVAVATLWAGYWFWQSNAQEQAIERWFDDRRHAGWASRACEVPDGRPRDREVPGKADRTPGR